MSSSAIRNAARAMVDDAGQVRLWSQTMARMTAFRPGLTAAMRANVACIRSTAEISRLTKRSTRSTASIKHKSSIPPK